MKKRWLIFTLVSVCLGAIIPTFFRSPLPATTVQLKFIGYTNSTTFTGAVFQVEFPKDVGDFGWGAPQVSRKEGAQWKQFTTTNSAIPKITFLTIPPISSTTIGIRKSEVYTIYPIETTNVVWRIVNDIVEEPRRTPVNIVLTTIRNWLGKPPDVLHNRHYFITNETVIRFESPTTNNVAPLSSQSPVTQ